MSRNTRYKTALNKKNAKDPDFGILSNTIGCVSKAYHLDYSRIYSIFYSDFFTTIQHGQSSFINISKSQIHAIVSRPTFMPYTDPVKWIIDPSYPQYPLFNYQAQTLVTSFLLKVFARCYSLNPP